MVKTKNSEEWSTFSGHAAPSNSSELGIMGGTVRKIAAGLTTPRIPYGYSR